MITVCCRLTTVPLTPADPAMTTASPVENDENAPPGTPLRPRESSLPPAIRPRATHTVPHGALSALAPALGALGSLDIFLRGSNLVRCCCCHKQRSSRLRVSIMDRTLPEDVKLETP